jgi:hypothetical protein
MTFSDMCFSLYCFLRKRPIRGSVLGVSSRDTAEASIPLARETTHANGRDSDAEQPKEAFRDV